MDIYEIDRDAFRRNGRPLNPWERGRHVARIMSKIAIGGPDECWEWQGPKIGKGYGQIGGGRYAHRAVLEFVLGRPLDKEQALHTCDNPPCCNPRHLFVGSNKENHEDMMRKGRHHLAKLTAEQVREIRRLRAKGLTQTQVAAQFDVSSGTIAKLDIGMTYAWVT